MSECGLFFLRGLFFLLGLWLGARIMALMRRGTVEAERDALRAKLDEARAALEPFAAAEVYCGSQNTDPDDEVVRWLFAIGHIRRARFVLEKIKGVGMSEHDDWAEINRLEAENARLRAELAAERESATKANLDFVKMLRRADALEAERDALRAQLDAANEALLIGEMMLSELGINASEKCQMAYDHLNRYRTSDE